MIDLGIGQPSADLLPVELLRRASESFFEKARPSDLSYGAPAGGGRFLESLAEFLQEEYGSSAKPDSLVLTAGASQALDLAATLFSEGGDTVFVEEPSYYLAFQIFRDHGLNLVGVPVDEGGMRLDSLEMLLAEHSPAFVYVIPSYQNPGGQCMRSSRRARLIELRQRYGFLILADEVYQLLHCYNRPPPAFGT
jgi:2-aminoadipate transaminase